MTHNINKFLTSQSGPVYNKINNILHKFQRTQNDGISPKVYIYGDFIRELIKHHYNPTEKFTFNKVNVWLDYSPYAHTFESWNTCIRETFLQLKQELDITKSYEEYKEEYKEENYEEESFYSVNVTIDSIKFNFYTTIEINFSETCQLTINNLFIDLFGNIFKRRKCVISIDQIITHIQKGHKILVLYFMEIKCHSQKNVKCV